MRSQPYYANVLIDVALPTQTVSTPAEQRHQVVLFPMPRVAPSGRLGAPDVHLDTGTWFVHDAQASTLPARCPSQRAAQMLADTWMGNCATEAVDPTNPLQVTNWCRWFVAQFPDCATFAPLKNTPTGDALASTVAAALTIVAHQPGPEWPQGSDEEDAETLAAVGAVPAPTQASPDAGQANTDATEVAS
jgi:hypothetical protein